MVNHPPPITFQMSGGHLKSDWVKFKSNHWRHPHTRYERYSAGRSEPVIATLRLRAKRAFQIASELVNERPNECLIHRPGDI
jgi:hypothetical protein